MKNHQNNEPQISEREIERRYLKLEIKPADPNRVNCYHCDNCGYVTKTIDIHYGVTPMFIQCDCCKKSAKSMFYNDTRPNQKPEFEWFVPTLEEMYKHKRNPAMIDHIFRGGLDMRRVKNEK